MKIGLGIGIGYPRPGSGSAVFDPTTLALTGYWRAPFTASPWTPTASAGASGTNGDLTEATNAPAAGAGSGGLASADFDGTNDRLQAAANNNVFYSSTALSGWCLFYADTASAPAGDEYSDGQFFADITNSETVVGYTSSGLHLGFYASGYKTLDVAASTGAWHLGQWKLESGALKARIDGGAWSTVACGALSFLTPGAMSIGKGYGVPAYFDGQILELACADIAISDADFDNVLSYVNATYGLSLT